MTSVEPKPTVFITSNAKQDIPALVAEHAVLRHRRNPNRYDVRIIRAEGFPFLWGRDGQRYLRDGGHWRWIDADVQTFMFLRFHVPNLMGFRGRALALDPDMFPLTDVAEILFQDFGDKAILCHERRGDGSSYSSALMVLDCARLTHWDAAREFAAMFDFSRDHDELFTLRYEDFGTLGFLDPVWNSHDRLEPSTKLLHLSRQRTQPWKTGLPLDFYTHGPQPETAVDAPPSLPFREGRYEPHPDPRQERFFFALLRQCLEAGSVTEAMLREAMAMNYIRHDTLALIARVKPGDAEPFG